MSASGLLQGQRILVTRAKEQATSFSKKIKELGGKPIEIPLIKIQAPQYTKKIEQTMQKLHTYNWIVFTSVNGVHYFFDYLQKFNAVIPELNRPRIAVVGIKTFHAIEKKGLKVDVIPKDFVAESLMDELAKRVKSDDKILLARGNLARSFLPEKLAELGIKVEDLVIYETVLNIERQVELFNLLESRSLDIITFTSSSTVTNFVELLEGTAWKDYLESVQIACIGPITEQTAIDVGLTPQIVASDYTIAGLLEAIIHHVHKGGPRNEGA